MKKRVWFSLVILLAVAAICFSGCEVKYNELEAQKVEGEYSPLSNMDRIEGEIRIKKPVVAGSFYPEDPKALSEMIDGYLGSASDQPVSEEDLFGLIAPHAGYIYSGPVAGYAYNQLKGRAFDRVVILGPSHYSREPRVSILDVDRYKTPLGTMRIDRAATRALIESADWIRYSPRTFIKEHCLEVQIPFLQKSLPDVPVALIAMADNSMATATQLAEILHRVYSEGRVLFVISSDLSHYHPYDIASEMDQKTLGFITSMNTAGLSNAASAGEVEACGIGPILTLMELFRLRGGKDVRLLKYENSGDTAGGKDRVVGYGAIGFFGGGQGEKIMSNDYLSKDDKLELLRIARKTVEEYVRTGKRPDYAVDSKILLNDGAAFVTLRKKGSLRGCIGNVIATEPLYLSVRNMAVAACSEDPRFPRVTMEELAEIDIEVSVLTPMKPVKNPETIQVGRDGLMIKKGYRQGLLLPQVPDEFGWDRETFLDQTCRKAGLPLGCWKDDDTQILSFQAIVFQES